MSYAPKNSKPPKAPKMAKAPKPMAPQMGGARASRAHPWGGGKKGGGGFMGAC